ncbi:transposable element Tc1 transposase [Trichonephila clavipes]|nr:transposable element Tc1 transposase [Trichonephila clavipes]
MRPLESAGKNGWNIADFSVMMVAVDLGTQQFDCQISCHSALFIVINQYMCVLHTSVSHGHSQSEESRFQLCPEEHRRRVWRRRGQHADPAFTIASHTGPQSGVMVWGALSFDSRTHLVVIRGTIKAQQYV